MRLAHPDRISLSLLQVNVKHASRLGIVFDPELMRTAQLLE